jgi:hypothetical protein
LVLQVFGRSLVTNAKWEIIIKRIRGDDIPDDALKASSFWSKLLISPIKWDILLKRIREDRIPGVATQNNGVWSKIVVPEHEWQTVCKLMRDKRLQNCFGSGAFWKNCTKDWTSFFEHAKYQKAVTRRYLQKYSKER